MLEVYSDKLKITVSSDQIVDGDLASILTLLWDLIVEFELSTEVTKVFATLSNINHRSK